jgi:hypothetical protein
MIKEELVRRSPIRLFEESILGGLASGEMGIIASSRGVGKTSVLVQLALDRMLQGKKVIHISFARHLQNVFKWYDDIFDEFVGKMNLDDKEEVKDEISRNRVLLNFNQEEMTLAMVTNSLRAIIVDGGFAADTVIVDGFDFSAADSGFLAGVKKFSGETGLSIWYNCTVNGDEPRYDGNNMPTVVSGFAELIDVAVVLQTGEDHVGLSVSKNRGKPTGEGQVMRLDPETLLILER